MQLKVWEPKNYTARINIYFKIWELLEHVRSAFVISICENQHYILESREGCWKEFRHCKIIQFLPTERGRRDSSVGAARGYGLDVLGLILGSVQIDSVAHPASYPVGTRGLFPLG
jgi:hypothetical protein